jgi:hypothetical protein
MFQKRVITYETVDLQREELATLAEAVEITGLSMPGLISAINRGQLTEVIDQQAGYHGRRLLLRAELGKFQHGRVVA